MDAANGVTGRLELESNNNFSFTNLSGITITQNEGIQPGVATLGSFYGDGAPISASLTALDGSVIDIEGQIAAQYTLTLNGSGGIMEGSSASISRARARSRASASARRTAGPRRRRFDLRR